jgi:hypothetical protein
VSWQEAGVIMVVGAAVVYVVRKLLWPARPKPGKATFIPIRQLKPGSRTKP